MRNAQAVPPVGRLTVRQALALDVLQGVTVEAGHAGLDRAIRWVHIVDIPDVVPWLRGSELLLTTGYGWPKDPLEFLRTVRALNDLSLAGVLFAVGKYVDEIPRRVRREADRARLPILQAPYGLRFVDVTEAVHRRILDQQQGDLSRLEEIHRVLTRAAVEAEDLQGLAAALSELTGKAVTIETPDFRLLACTTGTGAADPVRLETIRRGQTPDSVVRGLAARGLLQELRGASGAVRTPAIPHMGLVERVVCPIRTAHDLLGYMCVLEGDAPLSDVDVRATEQAATLAALHILRQQAISTVERRVRSTFVEALVHGDFGQSAALRERAQLLGFDADAPHAVAVLTIAPSAEHGRRRALYDHADLDLREAYHRALRSAVAGLTLDPHTATHLNQIIFILPIRNGWDRVRALVESLWSDLQALDPGVPLLLTVGEPCAGGDDVSRSYDEAQMLVDAASPPTGVYFYDQHVLAQVITGSDRAALRRLEGDLVRRVEAYGDVREATATLLAFLESGFNVQATACRLGVHRNTVRARLARIEECTPGYRTSPQFWAQLVVAEEARRYGRLEPSAERDGPARAAAPSEPGSRSRS